MQDVPDREPSEKLLSAPAIDTLCMRLSRFKCFVPAACKKPLGAPAKMPVNNRQWHYSTSIGKYPSQPARHQWSCRYPPSEQACPPPQEPAPGHPDDTHDGTEPLWLIVIPPGAETSFSVSPEVHLGQATESLFSREISSSNWFPHPLHLYSKMGIHFSFAVRPNYSGKYNRVAKNSDFAAAGASL